MVRGIAIAVILGAGVFIAAAIIVSSHAPTNFEGLRIFDLVAWLDPISLLGPLTVAVVVAVRLLARQTALAVPAIVCAIFISIYFLFLLMPA